MAKPRYVIIFKATIKELDEAYIQYGKELRDRALSDFGCLQFDMVTEGESELALSYWTSLEDIQKWKQDPQHLKAQQLGTQKWYSECSVELCELITK